MADPPSTPPIKAEPLEESKVTLPFGENEIISLISDDEEEQLAAMGRTLGSPFHEQSHPEGSLDLGTSLLSSKPSKSLKPPKTSKHPKPSALSAGLAAMLQKARIENAQKLRQQPKQVTPPQAPRGGGRSMFVTESQPGTPNAAEDFMTLQQDVDQKRKNGTLTWEEEVGFERAKAAEQARIRKEHLDNAFDASVSGEDEQDQDPRLSPDIPSLPDEVQPKKPGRKRKADSPHAGTKKRRAPNKSTEDLLDAARRKREERLKGKGTSKAKGKGKGAKQAPKKQGGRKKRPADPNLMRSINLGGNVFEDAAQNRDLPNQPIFEPTSRKDQALKSLIASVPEEYRPVAKIDKKYLDDAMKDFTGQGAVKPAEGGKWSVKGMKATLESFQVLGVAFMRKRENSTQEPRGGILADEMGLGKTIMMLTNIVNGKSLQQKKCRTTLIVASPALVSQWRREITAHVYTDKESKHGIGRVKEYHASAQIKSNQEIEELCECDVILTTYNQVLRSYPKAEIPPELTGAEEKNAWWKKHYEREKGPLHKIQWHRIVLDEAQAIKNHKSLTSISCRALSGRHCWGISGTPILNNIGEFYPLFRFIKEPHTGSIKLFRKNFCSDSDPDRQSKLDIFLRKFMIRRTHLDTLFNARLLDLPQPKQGVMKLDFNEIERNVYEIVKSRFVQRINCISKAGELDRQYGHIWTMITRLRQLTSHILMAQGTMTDLLEREDFERLHKIASDELSEESKALLTHLRFKLKEKVDNKQTDSREGATILEETETVPNHRAGYDAGTDLIGGKHGLKYKFSRYLDDLLNSESFEAIASRTHCCGCRQPPHDPHVTSCFHIYCYSCLHDMQLASARLAQDRHRCNECGSYYTEATRCQESLEKFSASYDNTTGSTEGEKASLTGKSKKSSLQSWVTMRGEVLPSAKTVAVKCLVLEWLEEDPNVKIIIYSQWIPMLHILGRICQTEGWSFERYHGSMSHEARDKAIQNFGDPTKGRQILLASLKCGGLGLNLTMASRVISLDPWWNKSLNQQAFCRVFRIGQQNETRMSSLMVRNTIDEAMFQLQETKQEPIDAAMEGSGRKERVSVHELMRLFGRVHEDENGQPFIFAHNADGNGVDDEENNTHHSPPPRPAEDTSDEEGDGLDNDV